MNNKKSSNSVLLLLLSASVMFIAGCGGSAPTRVQIVGKYPTVEEGSTRAENKSVLCPFVRMLERSGSFDSLNTPNSGLVVPVSKLVSTAKEFGCGSLECGSVASAIAGSQKVGGVDIERLHEAGAVSHDCGFTFELGGTQVSDVTRQATIDRLSELADQSGHLDYSDIEKVQVEICASQGVARSAAGILESKLMFAYLGGVDRGFIDQSDVVRFFNAEMPKTKTKSWINAALIGAIK